MDQWLNVAGAGGLGLVFGWMLESRLVALRLDVRRSVAAVLALALLLLLVYWRAGMPATIAASCALPAGVVAHRSWLSSLPPSTHSRMGDM